MTIVNLDFSAVQVCRIKSTDTLGQVCLTICNGIIDYLISGVLHQDPISQDRVETACTMIHWYIGLLTRACPPDREYAGLPIIQMIYLEKTVPDPGYPVRHVFNLRTLEKVPAELLTKVLHKVVTTTISSIASRVTVTNTQKAEEWVTRIIGLLYDIHRAVDPDLNGPIDHLDTVITRYLIPNNHNVFGDFV